MYALCAACVCMMFGSRRPGPARCSRNTHGSVLTMYVAAFLGVMVMEEEGVEEFEVNAEFGEFFMEGLHIVFYLYS